MFTFTKNVYITNYRMLENMRILALALGPSLVCTHLILFVPRGKILVMEKLNINYSFFQIIEW